MLHSVTDKYYTPFDPRSIRGLAMWLDASDASTLVLDGSSNVQAWLDKSGRDNHAVQLTANDRPNYTSTGVLCATGAQRMDMSRGLPGRPYELFIAGSVLTSSANTFATLVRQSNTSLLTLSNTTSTIRQPIYRTGTTNTTWGGTLSATSPAVFTLGVDSGTTAYMFMGGNGSGASGAGGSVSSVTDVSLNALGNTVAGGEPFGTIHEVLMYDTGFMNVSARRAVESYLAWKWRSLLVSTPVTQPTDISGCSLWLDANDVATMTLSNTSNVMIWGDKSGNGYDVSQATVGNAPVFISNTSTTVNHFGLNSIQFTPASSNWFFLPQTFVSNAVLNRPFSFFIVEARTNTAASNMLIGGSNTGTRTNMIVGYRGTATMDFDFYGDGTFGYVNSVVNPAEITMPTVWHFTNSGTTKEIYSNNCWFARDGTSANLVSWNFAGIGRGFISSVFSYYGGRMNEIIFYDRALSASERTRVTTYLMDKWKLYYAPNLHWYHPARSPPPFSRPFIPSDLGSNLLLWLDAADRSSLTLSGSNITEWLDKSPSFRPMSISGTPVYTSNAASGQYGVYLDGSSWFRGTIGSLGSAGVSAFAVASMNNATQSNGRLLSISPAASADTTGIVPLHRVTTNQQIGQTRGTLGGYQGIPSYDTPFTVSSVTDTVGVNGFVAVDGSQGPIGAYQAINLTAVTRIAVGQSAGTNSLTWTGHVFEIMMFNNNITSSDIRLLEGYLRWKWNTPQLQPGQQYYSVPVPYRAVIPRAIAASNALTFLNVAQTNCILWLDAQDATTYTVSNGLITNLIEKSGYGGTLNTATLGATYLPGYSSNGINGYPCFTTNISNPGQRLLGTYSLSNRVSSNQYTFIAMIQPTGSLQASSRLFSTLATTGDDFSSGGGWSFLTTSTTAPYTMTSQRIATVSQRTPTLASNVPTVFVLAGTSSAAGTLATWGFGLNSQFFNTGGGSLWALNVGEAFVFRGLLATPQIQEITSYLAWKWGTIATDTSATNPYRQFKP